MIRVSEMVLPGHPDKFCDQIADAIIGECVGIDADAYGQVEVSTWSDHVWLSGGICTRKPLPRKLDEIVVETGLALGYRPGNHIDASRYKGRVYGAPMRNAVKSVVWYPKAAYDEAGLPKDPDTIQALRTDVADKIAAKGIKPWCIGWESDQATGWVGTDWIEELMLRMYGPTVYDDWTSHRIPFNDERVVKAFDEAAKFNKDPEMVLGGTKGVLNTAFGDAMTPAFSKPPKCMLHRQGNFATTFYPKPVQADLDNQVGIYVFPKFEGGYDGSAILGGGDLAALFNGNDDDSKKVMAFITSDKFGAPWAKAGGWLSPHKTFDLSNYPNETTKKIALIANKASVLRFDGSDLMPKSIGSDVFWKEMVKWENGQSSKQTADNIEAAWPKS